MKEALRILVTAILAAFIVGIILKYEGTTIEENNQVSEAFMTLNTNGNSAQLYTGPTPDNDRVYVYVGGEITPSISKSIGVLKENYKVIVDTE